MLQAGYREAADAANMADKAISDLQVKRPPVIQIGKRKDWDRKAAMFTAMFGLAPDPQKGLDPSDPNVQRARRHYQTQFTDSRAPAQGSSAVHGSHWLFCTDQWLSQWVEPDDPVPEGDTVNYKPGQTPPKFKDTSSYPLGAWFAGVGSQFKPAQQYWSFSKTTPRVRPCNTAAGSQTIAFTLPKLETGIVTFCDHGLSKFTASLSDQKKKVKRFDSIVKLDTTAGEWSHELGHLLDDVDGVYLDDLQAVDEKGQDKVDGTGKPILIYEWYDCVTACKGTTTMAGHNYPNLPRSFATAQTFTFFAVAMYLDNWNWYEGWAS
ncbi:MAG: hypothetical protein Q9165_003752 [Trypethelium subeluteriae]